jgi:hypothetical protein
LKRSLAITSLLAAVLSIIASLFTIFSSRSNREYGPTFFPASPEISKPQVNSELPKVHSSSEGKATSERAETTNQANKRRSYDTYQLPTSSSKDTWKPVPSYASNPAPANIVWQPASDTSTKGIVLPGPQAGEASIEFSKPQEARIVWQPVDSPTVSTQIQPKAEIIFNQSQSQSQTGPGSQSQSQSAVIVFRKP